MDRTIEEKLLEISGVSNLTRDVSIRLYCDDAFNVLNEVLAVLNSAGMKAPVRMVEPSLEDAFAFFVTKDEVEKNG